MTVDLVRLTGTKSVKRLLGGKSLAHNLYPDFDKIFFYKKVNNTNNQHGTRLCDIIISKKWGKNYIFIYFTHHRSDQYTTVVAHTLVQYYCTTNFNTDSGNEWAHSSSCQKAIIYFIIHIN